MVTHSYGYHKEVATAQLLFSFFFSFFRIAGRGYIQQQDLFFLLDFFFNYFWENLETPPTQTKGQHKLETGESPQDKQEAVQKYR